jgi:MOSC domain-containing protein YiiM
MLSVLGRPYTRDDALATLGVPGPWWQQLTDGRGPDAVARLTPLRQRLEATLRGLSGSPATDLEALAAATRSAMSKVHWDVGTAAAVQAALVTITTTLHDAGDVLRQSGALPATATGHVDHLHRSDGGVPKTSVDTVEIDLGGVVGDRQATRRHHGRPWQALCLWSSAVIDHLAAQGHPIDHGYAGENVTIGGLDWASVRSGVQLRIGSDALAEVSVFALPCVANAAWFADRDFEHMHHDRGPVSRVYATVLQGGLVSVGDPVVLEP